MLTKTLGLEITSIINQALLKRDEVLNLINKVLDEASDTCIQVDLIVKKIVDTIIETENSLNIIENELYNLEIKANEFSNMDSFYNDILPQTKEKYIQILESYFNLLFNFEEIIENKILVKINELKEQGNFERDINYNVYNYNSIKEESNEYSKDYLYPSVLDYTWYSGKFEDGYLDKEIVGSLSLFHIKEDKNERLIDFISGNSNTIYENILFHPDYGMIHYISTGVNQNNTSIMDPESMYSDYQHFIQVNDEFNGEISEIKNIPFVNHGTFSEISGLSNESKLFKMFLNYSHIASNNQGSKKLLKDGSFEIKYFIHKIKALEPRDLEIPSYFFIGQNKDTDDANFTQYIDSKNASSESNRFLTPYRDRTKGTNWNIGSLKDVHNILLDTGETLNKDNKMISKTGLFTGFKSSQIIMNFRNNKFTLLQHRVVNNSNNQAISKYVYDTISYGANLTIPFTSRNSARLNHYYDLYENLTFRILPGVVQNQDKTLVSGQGWINIHCVSPIKNGILHSCSRFDIVQNPFTSRFAGSFIQSNLMNASIPATSVRNDVHLFGATFLTKYEQGDLSRNAALTTYNKQLIFNYNIYEFFNIDNDNMRYNKVFYTSLIKDIWYRNTAYTLNGYCNKTRGVNNLFSVIDGSANEINSGGAIDTAFLEELKEKVKEELSVYSNNVPLGNIIAIPFSQDNPIFLYDNDNVYAKSGSVLNKEEFKEFYELIRNKYTPNKYAEYDIMTEFVLPDLSNKYLVGTTTLNNALSTIDQIIPDLGLEITFDADIDEENSLYNGIISDQPGSDFLPVVGGGYGIGLAKESIRIPHMSESAYTKGNDLRVDMYIKVK